LKVCVGVEGLAGVAKENWVGAGGKIAEGVVNEVCGRVAKNVADRAEVVGQGPEDLGGRGVGEEFVLLIWRPEVYCGSD